MPTTVTRARNSTSSANVFVPTSTPRRCDRRLRAAHATSGVSIQRTDQPPRSVLSKQMSPAFWTRITSWASGQDHEADQACQVGKMADKQHVIGFAGQPVPPDFHGGVGVETVRLHDPDAGEILCPYLRRLAGAQFPAVDDSGRAHGRALGEATD